MLKKIESNVKKNMTDFYSHPEVEAILNKIDIYDDVFQSINDIKQ